MEKGILTTNGVHLQEHEYHTVKVLLAHGYDVELIRPSQTKGQRTPDISVQGVLWEMKSPTGNSKNTMRHTVQGAGHQAKNVIVDLHRCKLSEEQAIKEIAYYLKLSKYIRQIRIITADENILDL